MYDDVTYVYDGFGVVWTFCGYCRYDDVTYVYDDVTYVYDGFGVVRNGPYAIRMP